MFLSYKEVNYKFVDVSCIRRMKINKYLLKNSYLISKLNMIFFFWFRRLNEFDLEISKLYFNLFIIWLVTGNVLYIDKFNSRYVKGMRYYSFIYRTKGYLRNIFLVLDFWINFMLESIRESSLRLLDKKFDSHLYEFYDFSMLANMKMSNLLYLPTLMDRMYIKFYNNSNLIPINKELNLYKFSKNNGSLS